MRLPRVVLVTSLLLGYGCLALPGAGSDAVASTIPVPAVATVMAGSTSVACEVTGHGKSNADVDLEAADRGYTFAYNKGTFWLFGDTMSTATTPARVKFVEGLDNDSMATSPLTKDGHCPTLTFATKGAPVAGAYASPSVVPDPWPGTPPVPQVSLKTGESAVAGLQVDGTTYVVFETDNPSQAVPPGPSNCGKGCMGADTRSVMAKMTNAQTLTFQGLYDLSAPAVTDRYGNGAKFVDVAMEPGNDGYVYLWGIPQGGQRRMGAPYLARKRPADMGTSAGITYFHGYDAKGLPEFVAGESNAIKVFSDSPPCAGQIGVSWNRWIGEWLMLYDCDDASAGHPAGIYLRTSPSPWGPWSSPQTVFDPRPWSVPAKPGQPDASTRQGFCYFMHDPQSAKCPTGSPNPPAKAKRSGAYYGPYFVNGMTTGTFRTSTAAASSTIFYTLDTDNPYGQLILRTTLRGPPVKPTPPPCKGTTCT
jgi:Domain of unknown function (DUF4185)